MNKQASKTSTKKAAGTRTGRTKLNYSLYLQYQDREYDMADLKELILDPGKMRSGRNGSEKSSHLCKTG